MYIVLYLAEIMLGYTVLPFGDLATIPFLICLMVPAFRGNIIRTVIAGSFYIAVGLYIATWISPLFTEAAKMASFDMGMNTSISADRKSTRLNSSHVSISYAVFC